MRMRKTSGSNTTRLPTPNYMKSTTSADAKREESKVSTKSLHRKGSTNSPNISSKNITASSRPKTTLLRKGSSSTHGNLQAGLATCSSTLKGSKFPGYLKQNPAAAKVCRYSYCCCNGRQLCAPLPPLKCLVSARRKPQSQRCIKQRCQSPTGGGGGAEIIGRDREEQPVSIIGAQDVPGLSRRNSHTDTCLEGGPRPRMEKESGTFADIVIPKSDDGIGCFFHEISQESLDEDEEIFNSDTRNKTLAPVLVPGPDDSSFEGPQSGDTTVSVCCNPMNGDEHNLRDKSLPNEDDATTDIGNCNPIQDHNCNQAESFNGDELDTGDSGLNSNEGECIIAVDELISSRNSTIPETEDTSSTQSTAKSNQEYDDPRCFNPRELQLQLLPLEPEPEPEAEKVNLRHQEVDARKNADEWMVDYALRQAVTRGANSSHRKVALIVEAIERVVPPTKYYPRFS